MSSVSADLVEIARRGAGAGLAGFPAQVDAWHDRHVGRVLVKLDKLGIAEDAIVLYSTGNGPHMNSWPDGAMTPLRSEKNTSWEVGEFLQTFLQFLPRQKAASFTIDQVQAKIAAAVGSGD